jgi:hypothetical protein
MSPCVTFSLVVTWLRPSLGVARLRLLTMEVLKLRFSRPRLIAACLQLTFNRTYCITVYWMAIANCHVLSSQSESYVTTDGQLASLSWYQAKSGAQNQIFVTVTQFLVCWCGAPSLTRGRVCRLQLLLARANQSQSQRCFRTSGLSPISLSSNQSVKAHDQRFLQLNSCDRSP